MSTPVFQLQPAISLPRFDRLLKARRARPEAGQAAAAGLAPILAAYGLTLNGPIEVLGSAGRSRVLVADTNAGKKLVKRYKANVRPSAVRHEHSILRYLAQVDFPAPRLVMTQSGDSLVQRGQDLYALFDYLDGYFQYGNRLYLPSQTRQFLTSAGQALGGLHDATRDFCPEGHNPNGFVSPGGPRARELAWFTDKLAWVRQQSGLAAEATPEVVAAVAQDGARLADQLPALDERLKEASLTRVIIHGDYGPYNLLFKRGQRVVLVDFELARLDWPLTDLAKSMTTFAHNRLGFSRRKAMTFVDAYRGAFDLAEDEWRYLPDVWLFLTLRRVVVCWYRYFKRGDARWAREAGDKLALADFISSNPLDW